MRPETIRAGLPKRGIRHRSGRVVGALCVAGALTMSAACANSSSSGSGSKPTAAVGSATSVAAGGSSTKAAGVIRFRALDAGGPQTIGALKNGSIDIAELFTFTPAIAENGWVTLEDDKHLQAADNFVPLIRTAADSPQVGAVVDAVTASLTHDDIMAMVKSVSVDGENPEKVADKFLAEKNLPGNLKATGKMTVGSANFAESEIVGQLYAGALKKAGVDVTFKDAVGARQVTMPMMTKGDLDLMPEFTYSLLAYLDSTAQPSNDLDEVTGALTKVLPKGLSIRKASDVSDVNVFVVTEATATKHSLKTLSDLAGVSDTLTMGGPPECPKNAQCIPGLEKVYGLRFQIK